MTTNEWLSKTLAYPQGNIWKKVDNSHSLSMRRPRAICKDGYSISIQAGYFYYSNPRKDGSDYYYEVELGFPNMEDDIIKAYAEDEDYMHTVYGYVPVEIVDKLLEKHGGIVALRENKEFGVYVYHTLKELKWD